MSTFESPANGTPFRDTQTDDDMTEFIRRHNRVETESVTTVKFDPSQVVKVVGSEASMLELTGGTPNETLAIRTDDAGRGAWLLTGLPQSDINNWQQIGLGVGTTEGTLAAGNDPRFSDLASALSTKATTPQVTTSDGDTEVEFREVVLCNAVDGPMTITLPQPLANQSSLVIHKIDATNNVVTILPPSGSQINGMNATHLGSFLAGVRIICDGQNFWTIP